MGYHHIPPRPTVTWLSCLAVVLSMAATRSGTTTTTTVDRPGDMYLTPSWGLTFGAGEHAEIDCGVFTAGHPHNATITWTLPNRTAISNDTTHRIHVERRDTNYPNDTTPGAFSVVTLHLYNLSEKDTGEYACDNVIDLPHLTSSVESRTIWIQVNQSLYVCAFETPALCGWTHDDSGGMAWYHHDAADENSMRRARGLRYDHTYGPGKHSGHFLDIDIKRDDPDPNAVARLRSPMYEAHETEKCLEFWYILHGPDYDHLKVIAEAVDHDGGQVNKTLIELRSDNLTSGEWSLLKVKVPPMETSYHLVLQGQTCANGCRIGTIALDDLHIEHKACTSVNHDWPDVRLKVRLVNGNHQREGRLEVLHDGMWGTVCDTQFGDNDTKVICNMLGFNSSRAVARRNAHFGSAPDNYVIWLHKVGCSGSEPDIGSCLSKGEFWGDTGCEHAHDAAVLCDGPPLHHTAPPLPSTPTPTTTTTTTSTTVATPLPPFTPSTTTERAPTTTTAPSTTTTTATTTTKNPPVQPVTERATTTTTLWPRTPTTTSRSNFVKPTPGGSDVVADDNATALPSAESYTLSPLKKKTGAALGIAIIIVLVVLLFTLFFYKRRKYNKKSKYIVFSNPNYHREHLPTNDISMDSPLTSSTQSILA